MSYRPFRCHDCDNVVWAKPESEHPNPEPECLECGNSRKANFTEEPVQKHVTELSDDTASAKESAMAGGSAE